MTKLNRACPASTSVDRRNCHEFGSVERFFNFLIPINLIHTFMITDELHSEQTLLVAPEHRRYCMSALPPKADMCIAQPHVCFGPIADMASYSRTSSARASTAGGMVRLRDLVVLRLTTISY